MSARILNWLYSLLPSPPKNNNWFSKKMEEKNVGTAHVQRKYPTYNSAEKDGWKVDIVFKGISTMGFGGPVGVVTLSGHGYEVVVGDSRGFCPCCHHIANSLPVEITDLQKNSYYKIITPLMSAFMAKYKGKEIDRKLVEELFYQAVAPYYSETIVQKDR